MHHVANPVGSRVIARVPINAGLYHVTIPKVNVMSELALFIAALSATLILTNGPILIQIATLVILWPVVGTIGVLIVVSTEIESMLSCWHF
jgi:hypothetical protein